tara:strand:+ start:98 stop:343 length:246 start_codon:yes stop_codon:yes gene_type:complete
MQLIDQDKKKIRDAMQEASNSLIRMEAERDLIKTIVEDLFEQFKIPKKTLNRMIKVYHKQNFNEEIANNDEFQTLYESVTK